MKINWKVRFSNPVFISQLVLAIFVPILAYMGITLEDLTTWGTVGSVLLEAISNPYVLFLVVVSVYNSITDPTVAGLSDSKQALSYRKPRKDDKVMVRIALDAGHGIHTGGKRTPDDEREWSFNNKVILSAIEHLNEYENVQITRLDDPSGKRDVPLKERTDKANKFKADVMVSMHHNAYKGVWGSHTGTETYTHTRAFPESERIAKVLHKHILNAYGLRDRGLKKANFHMLRETDMPSILIEGGFMDSTIDIKKLRDDKVLDAAGKAIAEGLAEYFTLKKKEKSKPKPSGKLYKVQIGAFKNKANADQLAFRAKARGFDQYVVRQDGLYKVQIGAYSKKSNADAQEAKAKKAGFDTYIVYE